MDEMDELKEQINQLLARVATLEDRVSQLETGAPSRSTASSNNEVATTVSAPKEGLVEALSAAFQQIGEGDAAAIRQQLAKNGFAEITRSDINKVLYANKNLFEIARQDGMKPIWRAVTQEQE
jgi:Adenosine deaminase z-alpha domain